ncbi:LCP family protein [Candidatus Nomurabacteria bacterium]|nr:LCP family protein [Candidatus Nomurabacteria bacterium]
MAASDFTKKKINFIEEEHQIELQKRPEIIHQTSSTKTPQANRTTSKNSKRRKKISYFFIFSIIFLGLLSNILADGNNSFLSGIKHSYLLRQIFNIVSPAEKYLQGEQEDRINFLILGMGGEGHSGPYLTDTIILASFQPSSKKAALISIPRDMIVPVSKNNYKKINSVYTIGKNQTGDGGAFTKEIVSETLGLPIHYFVSVDFQGFVEIIDSLGGVDVTVDRDFTDYQFPTEDYKYQVISFEQGEQEMDGLTALRFARSRHGNNGEGSDFSRSIRQQKILSALKDKITSFNTLINPKKITDLFSLVNQYTQTDLEPWEAVKLVHMVKGLDSQQIVSQSIDARPGGFLKAGIALDGAYILQPVTGNFEQIQKLAANIFDLQEVSEEKANIVIQNGTEVPGLALQGVNHLNYMGYSVLRYGNALEQDKKQTILYDYSGNKENTRKTLEKIFATKALTNIPDEYSNQKITEAWDIRDENNEFADLDFLIILGQDQVIDENLEIVTTIDPSLFNTSTTSSSIEATNQDQE